MLRTSPVVISTWPATSTESSKGPVPPFEDLHCMKLPDTRAINDWLCFASPLHSGTIRELRWCYPGTSVAWSWRGQLRCPTPS